MKTLVVLGALGAAALGLAACEDYYPAAPPPPPGAVAVAPAYGVPAVAVAPACFRTYDIKNHTVADDHGDPEELLAKLDEAEKQAAALREQLKAVLATALLR